MINELGTQRYVSHLDVTKPATPQDLEEAEAPWEILNITWEKTTFSFSFGDSKPVISRSEQEREVLRMFVVSRGMPISSQVLDTLVKRIGTQSARASIVIGHLNDKLDAIGFQSKINGSGGRDGYFYTHRARYQEHTSS